MAVSQNTRLGFVNTYLVTEPEGLTLIDTAVPRSGKAIRAAAEKRGAPIVRILLTHAHGDHIGSLDELAAELPEADVIIGERESKLLAKDKTLEPGEPDDKLRGGYPGARTKPDRLINPGDKVGSLEAIAAPGHTPGQLAFVDPRDGTLYCADSYSTLAGVATAAKRASIRFPLVAGATWHKETALETARALRALDPKRLAPGHGKVVENPGDEMQRAIDRGT